MRLSLLLLLQWMFLNAWACDFCGGTNLGLETGVLSGGTGNSVGLRTGFQQYLRTSDDIREQNWLMNWTVSGSYAPASIVQLRAVLPFFLEIPPGGTNRRAGTGDLLLVANLFPVRRTNVETGRRHLLALNAGLELPTGKYESDPDPEVWTLPMGSKSWDVVLGAGYVLKADDITISVSGLAKVHTRNLYGGRTGHVGELFAWAGYGFRIKDAVLQPYAGWKADIQGREVVNGFIREYSGGHVLWQVVGLQWNYYAYRLSLHSSYPIYQKLKSENILNGASASLRFTYQF